MQNLKTKLKSSISKNHNLEQKNKELMKKLTDEKEKYTDLKNIFNKRLVYDNQTNNIIKSVNQFENLKNELKNQFGEINPFDNILDTEKMIVVNFESVDQKINCPIICRKTSKFINVMQDFLDMYPEYTENDGDDLIFMSNGNKMVKMKSMEENGFKGYSILIYKRRI